MTDTLPQVPARDTYGDLAEPIPRPDHTVLQQPDRAAKAYATWLFRLAVSSARSERNPGTRGTGEFGKGYVCGLVHAYAEAAGLEFRVAYDEVARSAEQRRDKVPAVQLRVGDVTISNGRVEHRSRLEDGRVELEFKWLGVWADDPEAGEGGCFQPDEEFWVMTPRPPLVMTNPVTGTHPAEPR